jgi:nucleoside-diphosphate-sugar epimerase
MGRGFAPFAGSNESRFSLLYVEDLAAAILQWLSHPPSVMGVFELHDGHPGGYTWQDVIATVSSLRSRHIWYIPVPITSLRLLAHLNVAAARLGRYAPMLTPGKVRELNHPDWVCDNAPLNHAIGWKPQIALEEGLRRTFGWGAQLTPKIDFNR